MNQKFLIIVVLVILAAGVVFGFWQYQKIKVESQEFAGRVLKVENGAIAVEGIYLVPERPDLVGPGNTKTVTVLVDSQTRLVKERLFLPSAEEVKDSGGRYDPAKLKRETSAGSLSDLKTENVSVTAKAVKNVYGRSSFTASEIIYIEPVFPE